MDDLKKAIIYVVENSKADNAIKLFTELLQLLWTDGFRAGQYYMEERTDEDS